MHWPNAAGERLTLAALTDRRAVSGVPECIWRGAMFRWRIVPGIELDCRWREQIFTLGIGIDITCPALLEIERTRNDSVQSFAAEQAIHTIHEAGGLVALKVPPNEMDDTFRWRHSTALQHTAVTAEKISRGITHWHADTV